MFPFKGRLLESIERFYVVRALDATVIWSAPTLAKELVHMRVALESAGVTVERGYVQGRQTSRMAVNLMHQGGDMEPKKTGPFPYSPSLGRRPLHWPDGAQVALWVIPNVEFFALNDHIGPAFQVPPDVSAYAVRDYGARVGIWRIMEVLSRFHIRATVALNSDVCDQYPAIIEEGLKLGWEFMGHNQTNTRRLNQIPPEEERDLILATLDRIERATGTRPRGWLGSGLQETWRTLDYLVEGGCLYVADWVNDDQPYLMDINGARLVSMPYSLEINDLPAFDHHHRTPEEFVDMIRRQFTTLYREGAESGRVMAIALHPYIIGLPHRISALESALEFVCSHDGVWLTTGSEIAEQFLAV